MQEQGHMGTTVQMSELHRVRTHRYEQYLVGLRAKNCANVRAL